MIELDSEKFEALIPIIQSADINTMFAESVLEKKVKGTVYIDKETSPASFYIRHPYGMSLLYGETNNKDFYKEFTSYMLNLEKVRSKNEWLQVYPASLNFKIENILETNLIKKTLDEPYSPSLSSGETKVLEYQRLNFIFNIEKYRAFKKNLLYTDYKVIIISENIFNQSNGSVIPKHFWNNFSDFMKNGIGFTLLLEGNIPVSTAFSSFTIGNKLEIGIETNPEYQGFGFGAVTCAELIDYCIANDLEPVWSCNSGNSGSKKLANKLGFEECKRVPYYCLPV